MNLHLSDWEWLRVVTSLLFIWRGIQDLRDRSGTAWKTEDERKNFRKFSGVTLILGGAKTTATILRRLCRDADPTKPVHATLPTRHKNLPSKTQTQTP